MVVDHHNHADEENGGLIDLDNDLVSQISVYTKGARGTGLVNDYAYIQGAHDFASAGGSFTRIFTVYYPLSGEFRTDTQLVIEEYSSTLCDGFISNNLSNKDSYCMVFKEDSHIQSLSLDCNAGSGVSMGESGSTNVMNVGKVLIWKVGSGKIGLDVLGGNINFLGDMEVLV